MIVSDFELDLDRRMFYRRACYRDVVPDDQKVLIEKCIDNSKMAANAQCVYDYFDVKCSATGVYLDGSFLESSFLADKFQYHNKAVLFVCTAGFGPEKFGGGMLEQFLYHSVGAAMAESIARQFNKKIADENSLGEVKRWSPGYNDWRLKDQQVIFALLKPEQIGITLTSSYMMVPEFSVSGIIRCGKR